MAKKQQYFLDVADKGVPETMTEGEADFEKYLRGAMLSGELLDTKYVNVKGDTMTGALVITPTANVDGLLNVTKSGGDSLFAVNASADTVVINEAGGDVDTRIEGDTDVNLMFWDASVDMVGIGFNSPVAKLDISSNSSTQALRLRGTVISGNETQPSDVQTAISGALTNGINMEINDGNVATSEGPYHVFHLSSFDFTGISGTILGVEVFVDASVSDMTSTFRIKMSGDNGSTWSDPDNIVLTTSFQNFTLGGNTNLWGYNWTPDSFSNDNFLLYFEQISTTGLWNYFDYVTVKVYYTSDYSTDKIVDFFINTDGSLVLDLTPGNSTSQFFDFRSEDNEYGLVIRESDGTGTATYANLFVTAGTPDYLSINVNSIADTDALVITANNYVGVGIIPTTDFQVAGDTLLKPVSNSTTTLQVQQSDGTDVMVVDTTSKKVTVTGRDILIYSFMMGDF